MITDRLTGREVELIGGYERYTGTDVEGGREVTAVAVVRDVAMGREYKIDPTNLDSLTGLEGVKEEWRSLRRQGKIG
jgi:hypothetical protein